jgi:hypothetical protein
MSDAEFGPSVIKSFVREDKFVIGANKEVMVDH